MTYYRVQAAFRDPADLLTPEGQTSTSWSNEDHSGVGVSCCDSIEQLAAYLTTDGSGIPYGHGEWVLVEMEGDFVGYCPDDQPLIIPTEIVSVRSFDEAGFWGALDAACEASAA